MPQPHRGDREFLGVRVPPAVAEAVRKQAHAQGFRSMSDYVASVLAEEHGIPFKVRMAQDPAQEGLPLQNAS
jgi:hypothetical protein